MKNNNKNNSPIKNVNEQKKIKTKPTDKVDKIDKRVMQDAVYNMMLDHTSLTQEEKKMLQTIPSSEHHLKQLSKIKEAISHLPNQPMPIFLKMKLMHKLIGPSFHFWQIALVILALLSTSATLLIIDNWNDLGQVFQIIVGCFISLTLIPLSFFIYFQYEKQSAEIEKRINYNLNHITDYFKKWI